MKTTQRAGFALITSGNPPLELCAGQAHLNSESHIRKHSLLNLVQNYSKLCVSDIIHLKLLFP